MSRSRSRASPTSIVVEVSPLGRVLAGVPRLPRQALVDLVLVVAPAARLRRFQGLELGDLALPRVVGAAGVVPIVAVLDPQRDLELVPPGGAGPQDVPHVEALVLGVALAGALGVGGDLLRVAAERPGSPAAGAARPRSGPRRSPGSAPGRRRRGRGRTRRPGCREGESCASDHLPWCVVAGARGGQRKAPPTARVPDRGRSPPGAQSAASVRSEFGALRLVDRDVALAARLQHEDPHRRAVLVVLPHLVDRGGGQQVLVGRAGAQPVGGKRRLQGRAVELGGPGRTAGTRGAGRAGPSAGRSRATGRRSRRWRPKHPRRRPRSWWRPARSGRRRSSLPRRCAARARHTSCRRAQLQQLLALDHLRAHVGVVRRARRAGSPARR